MWGSRMMVWNGILTATYLFSASTKNDIHSVSACCSRRTIFKNPLPWYIRKRRISTPHKFVWSQNTGIFLCIFYSHLRKKFGEIYNTIMGNILIFVLFDAHVCCNSDNFSLSWHKWEPTRCSYYIKLKMWILSVRDFYFIN